MADSEASKDLAVAFERMVEDPDFAEAVSTDATAALAEYSLTDIERDALAADAVALEDSVQGFSQRSMAAVFQVGGLRTPLLIAGGPLQPMGSFTNPITDTINF